MMIAIYESRLIWKKNLKNGKLYLVLEFYLMIEHKGLIVLGITHAYAREYMCYRAWIQAAVNYDSLWVMRGRPYVFTTKAFGDDTSYRLFSALFSNVRFALLFAAANQKWVFSWTLVADWL